MPTRTSPAPEARRIRIGISSCLLGREVRFDGGHKGDRLFTDTLGRLFDWVPVCPEVELGLGVPRESLRLEGDPADPRLVFATSRSDITDDMKRWARSRIEDLARHDLYGFILKKDSPSCGMERVGVHATGAGCAGGARREGTGLFARALMDRIPLLPVEEEDRLNDPALRENFIERVFACGRTRMRRNHA